MLATALLVALSDLIQIRAFVAAAVRLVANAIDRVPNSTASRLCANVTGRHAVEAVRSVTYRTRFGASAPWIKSSHLTRFATAPGVAFLYFCVVRADHATAVSTIRKLRLFHGSDPGLHTTSTTPGASTPTLPGTDHAIWAARVFVARACLFDVRARRSIYLFRRTLRRIAKL